MKRIFFFLITITILSACSKDFDDKLEGKWQLKTVVTEGSVTPVDTVWYNFQNKLFMYQIHIPKTGGMKICHGFKTVNEGDMLYLELAHSPYESEEEMMKNFFPSTDWGMTKRTFKIEKLKGKELILEDKNTRYFFKKF